MLFKGAEFRKHANGVGLPQMRTVQLHEDKKHLLWFGKGKERSLNNSLDMSEIIEVSSKYIYIYPNTIANVIASSILPADPVNPMPCDPVNPVAP